MYDHDFYLYWSKPKENFHLEKSVLFCVIQTGNKFWVYFVQQLKSRQTVLLKHKHQKTYTVVAVVDSTHEISLKSHKD